ncbi:MAG TPA: aminopeptidase [Euryarchaeota archaeon]|nr:MAG: aminopeptidase [Thermococci archaeon]RLF96087.1 MAG: aminopeptidase [Thermococci archaeon]HDI10671.1 aminopeptidase [Euryarchaeota archaeon]
MGGALYERKWAWDSLPREEVNSFSEEYKGFLSEVKTERESVKYILKMAKKEGFENLEDLSKLSPGDRVYMELRGKSIILGIIGKEPRFRVIGSHIDAPRIDLKPLPVYEDSGIAMLKTHYYGGIKKYQWVNIPLAMHGLVVLKSGEKIEVKIGEEDDSPVLLVPDLLPHLAKKQGERKLSDGIKGEELRLIFGNMPYSDSNEKNKKEKDRVKKNVLRILKEEYGIEEEDLISAELEIVPALKARDAGIDKSMVAAYGQDDRVCAFTQLKATLDLNGVFKETIVSCFVDREEIGSDGDTGAKSNFLEYFLEELMDRSAFEEKLNRALINSKAISADVNAAVNPLYKEVHEEQNAAYLGKGVVLTKYTGARGKYLASEAHAEYVGWIRKILDERKIPWQPGLLGKVDEGGGGTIAKYLAKRGMQVIDMGPPVLSMHSPYEITSKADVYSAYLAYKAFFEAENK